MQTKLVSDQQFSKLRDNTKTGLWDSTLSSLPGAQSNGRYGTWHVWNSFTTLFSRISADKQSFYFGKFSPCIVAFLIVMLSITWALRSQNRIKGLPLWLKVQLTSSIPNEVVKHEVLDRVSTAIGSLRCVCAGARGDDWRWVMQNTIPFRFISSTEDVSTCKLKKKCIVRQQQFKGNLH